MSPFLNTITLRVAFKHRNLGRDINIHSMVSSSTEGRLEVQGHEFKMIPALVVSFSSARPRSSGKDTAEAELDSTRARA